MQILHAITKTESGYSLKIWEPAEITQDRVRPFLWEINLNAETVDEFGIILEQISLLHKQQREQPQLTPLISQDVTKMDFGKRYGVAIETDECITDFLCT